MRVSYGDSTRTSSPEVVAARAASCNVSCASGGPVCGCFAGPGQTVTLASALQRWVASALPVLGLLSGAVGAVPAGLGDAGGVVLGTAGLLAGTALAGLLLHYLWPVG